MIKQFIVCTILSLVFLTGCSSSTDSSSSEYDYLISVEGLDGTFKCKRIYMEAGSATARDCVRSDGQQFRFVFSTRNVLIKEL